MHQSRAKLWLLVVLFAFVSVAGALYTSVSITAIYVAILVAFALLHAEVRYGLEGAVAFTVICVVVSNAFENLSVVTGFPFGHYVYTDALGPKLFYVPLLIGPTYLGVGYLSWVLATVLAGEVRRGADLFSKVATPLIATFIMVLWDLSLDPGASTIAKWWIWRDGGGFFGVPLSNYLGWFFTVYIFMQLFALYLAARGPERLPPQPKSYYAQATVMYAIVAVVLALDHVTKGTEPAVDATGAVWRTGDIHEAAAVTSLLTMLFVVALAAIRIARAPAEA